MRGLMKLFAVGAAISAAALGVAAPALACAGLIGSNGAVNLGRTTTLAAYQRWHGALRHGVQVPGSVVANSER